MKLRRSDIGGRVVDDVLFFYEFKIFNLLFYPYYLEFSLSALKLGDNVIFRSIKIWTLESIFLILGEF